MDQSRRDFLMWTGLGAVGLTIPLPWWAKLFQPRGRSMIAVPANYGEIIPAGLTSREDLIDILSVISPHDTPFFQLLRGNPPLKSVPHEWITDDLEGVVPGNNIARFMPR